MENFKEPEILDIHHARGYLQGVLDGKWVVKGLTETGKRAIATMLRVSSETFEDNRELREQLACSRDNIKQEICNLIGVELGSKLYEIVR